MILLSLVPFKNYKVNVWRGIINNLSFWGLKTNKQKLSLIFKESEKEKKKRKKKRIPLYNINNTGQNNIQTNQKLNRMTTMSTTETIEK